MTCTLKSLFSHQKYTMKHEKHPKTSSFALLFWSILIIQGIFFSCTSSAIAYALGNETDRFALLKFKESISNDPRGVLRLWNDSVPFCRWPGISCCNTEYKRITALDLQNHNLRGTVSPYVGNLSFLRLLNLMNNSFYGEIPHQVGHLFRLKHLNLSHNLLEGKIPLNLSYCSQLRRLDLGFNNLTGTVPLELGSLLKLKFLVLSVNKRTGGIPLSLGNISSLELFSLSDNNLVGSVPQELGRLKSLRIFSLGLNNLSGVIPLELYNISSMRIFKIPLNHFHATLPPNIGLSFPNLQAFGIGRNKFFGTIPESFSNCSQLYVLDIGGNNFVGEVPISLGNLVQLKWLDFSINNLGSDSSSSLNFISSLANCSKMAKLEFELNNFGGVLPDSIGNLSGLTRLIMGHNLISGNIPSTLGNLANLMTLGVVDNLFSGPIPASFGKLQNLGILDLASNSLSGNIPSSLIGNLTHIYAIDISDNMLEGVIPARIEKCRNLQLLYGSKNGLSGAIPKELFGLSSLLLLNLSQNALSGSLPTEVGKLKNMYTLDLSENNLTHEIPKTIGDCESMELLYWQGNLFQGNLPPGLASLKGLQHLDLSRNNLSGKIPPGFERLKALVYLNLSFNDLEGEVPNKGVFNNTSTISLVGNSKLCGGIPKLQLPRCPNKESKQKKNLGLKLTTLVVFLVAIFIVFLGFVIFYFRRKSQRKMPVTLSKLEFLPKVSYKLLFQATNGFSVRMLIGRGGFGSVFKGYFGQDEIVVAIKVLDLQQKGAHKSFISECNALRNARHRNLVKILTCCSSIDYNGNEFKALVFEYMPNGSLEKWLHRASDEISPPMALNLIQRLDIAIDVASAIHYLHEDCEEPIVHCDLKPSNVLLDSKMTARVSDFGLARLIPSTNSFSDGQASTTGIKGTIGYVAPEYATGGEPSKLGDTYSYGILVLEMFTKSRPTDEIFKDDFTLHNFVKAALPGRLDQIVDSSLLPGEAQRSAHQRKCLASVLAIGLACSQDSANERMNMGEVIRELYHVKNAYTRVGMDGQ